MSDRACDAVARYSFAVALLTAAVLSGCSGSNDKMEPIPPAKVVTAVTLNTFDVSTVSGSDGVAFVNSGRYAVMPQFAATKDFATGEQRATVPDYAFTIGGIGAVTARVAPVALPPVNLSFVEAFHLRMRAMEREEAPRAIAFMQQLRTRPPVSLRSQSAPIQAVRSFTVLSALRPVAYTRVTGRLAYTGSNILVYVDSQAVAGPTFTDADYMALGRQFDVDLYPIDASAFGSPTDIDANGKSIVLFTPIVNRLTLSEGQCGTYVAGFVNSADLSGNASGNSAEILYLSVPGEPAGGPTCTPLSVALLRQSSPATFIHEQQHIISFGQHVLNRGGSAEDVWLNEGLSHIAEELGGKLYEGRYPCPNLPPCPASPGRSSPAQIFPDSAQGFLPPNFSNAYDYFSSRTAYSLTSPTSLGTLEERGAAWLFLRWLIDQKGEARLPQLVQTKNIGTANIEAMAGESFTTLFADFLAATLLDDFPGTTAGQIPSRYQYPSRNLRAIYARLNVVAAASFPTAYPLDVKDLSPAEKLTPDSPVSAYRMKPGTLDLFQFTSSGANGGLAFKPPTGRFLSTLNAQVTVIRLPD